MTWLPTEYGMEVYVPHDVTSDRYFKKQKCPHCDRKFSTASGIRGHVEQYHEKERD